MAEQTRNRAQGMFIPVALAGTLLTGLINLVGLAYWAGGLNARTSRNEADVKEARTIAENADRAQAAADRTNFQRAVEQAASIKSLETRMEDRHSEYRLFQDQTWGRIYHLPYKTPPPLP